MIFSRMRKKYQCHWVNANVLYFTCYQILHSQRYTKLNTSPKEPLAFFFIKLHLNKKQNTEKRSLLDHLLPGQAVVLCKSCFSSTFCTVRIMRVLNFCRKYHVQEIKAKPDIKLSCQTQDSSLSLFLDIGFVFQQFQRIILF